MFGLLIMYVFAESVEKKEKDTFVYGLTALYIVYVVTVIVKSQSGADISHALYNAVFLVIADHLCLIKVIVILLRIQTCQKHDKNNENQK